MYAKRNALLRVFPCLPFANVSFTRNPIVILGAVLCANRAQ
jgi:hypothetical protein